MLELAAPQLPNPALQPVPQYMSAFPHQPCSLQQRPNTEPEQVNAFEPPQVPSEETFVPVAVEAGATDDKVVEVRVAAVVVIVEETIAGSEGTESVLETWTVVTLEEDVARAEEVDETQSPNLGWHPVPQNADDEPQLPLLEQQLPKTEFLQVSKFNDWIPQRPDALTLRALTLRNRATMANSTAQCIIQWFVETSD